ncbi:uncharacterized protein LOC131606339 [Vicia villosa]|uniref:uncharacterized protein LOC131606339 n=1 Tax=Vicia villosa TaxID=3911 RepID=UPI00273CF301|nr:uncharacterized protein LOC131606339 [Vicia villosa]
MEGKSNQNDSSSSFVSELSGSKETHSSSSSSSPNEVRDKANKEKWDSILGTPDVIFKACGGGSQKTQSADKSSIYQDQRIEPCNLSSSIFYGGQDIIPHAQNTQNGGKNLWAKNVGEEEDLGIASRGDWWKGGLYY